MTKPTKEDGSLLLQLHGIAVADEDYQKAINWFFFEMNETNYDDYSKKNPMGSEGYKNFMKIGNYSELVGTLVNREVLSEDLLFELWGDMMWDKAKPIVYGLRKDLAMPRFLENFEVCAKKYPKWAENNPPKV
ncbi:MAG: DUF4760 domain-containing protein [Promethearchaeota archaeon]|jgi:hypothetical protein